MTFLHTVFSGIVIDKYFNSLFKHFFCLMFDAIMSIFKQYFWTVKSQSFF